MFPLAPLHRAIVKQNFTHLRLIVESVTTLTNEQFKTLADETLHRLMITHAGSQDLDSNIIEYLLWAGASTTPYYHVAQFKTDGFPNFKSCCGIKSIEVWGENQNVLDFRGNRVFLSFFSYSDEPVKKQQVKLQALIKRLENIEQQLLALELQKSKEEEQLDKTNDSIPEHKSLTDISVELTTGLIENVAIEIEQRNISIDKAKKQVERARQHCQSIVKQDDFQDNFIHFLRFTLLFNAEQQAQLGFITTIDRLLDSLVEWYKQDAPLALLEAKFLDLLKFLKEKNHHFKDEFYRVVLFNFSTIKHKKLFCSKLEALDKNISSEVHHLLHEQIDSLQEAPVTRFLNRSFIPYLPQVVLNDYYKSAKLNKQFALMIQIIPYLDRYSQLAHVIKSENSYAKYPFAVVQALKITRNHSKHLTAQEFFTPPLLPLLQETPRDYWLNKWQQLRNKVMSQSLLQGMTRDNKYLLQTLQYHPLQLFQNNGDEYLLHFLNIATALSPRELKQLGLYKALGIMLRNVSFFDSHPALSLLPRDIQSNIASFMPSLLADESSISIGHAKARVVFHSRQLVNVFSIKQLVYYNDWETLFTRLMTGNASMSHIRVTDIQFARILKRYLMCNAAVAAKGHEAFQQELIEQNTSLMQAFISQGLVCKERLLFIMLQAKQVYFIRFLIKQQANLHHLTFGLPFSFIIINAILKNHLPVDLLNDCLEALGKQHFVAWLNQCHGRESALDMILSANQRNYNQAVMNIINKIIQLEANPYLQHAISTQVDIDTIVNKIRTFSYNAINHKKYYQKNALEYAFEAATRDEKYMAIIIALIQQGAQFTHKVTFGHLIQLALKRKSQRLLDLPAMSLFLSDDANGNTALHFAVSVLDPVLAAYLVNRWPQLLNVQNKEEDTALHLAAKQVQLRPILWFYKKGANLTLKNLARETSASLIVAHLQSLEAEAVATKESPGLLQELLLHAFKTIFQKHTPEKTRLNTDGMSWTTIIAEAERVVWNPRHSVQLHPFCRVLEEMGLRAHRGKKWMLRPELKEILTKYDHRLLSNASCSTTVTT